MSRFLSTWATPLISGLFIVSLVSGIAIFFGIGRQYFQEMHEWLSMVLIAPFALHLWKNWRPFLAYLRRPAMISTGVLSLALALLFVAPGLMAQGPVRGAPPERRAIQLIRTTSLANLAPMLGQSGEELRSGLEGAGWTVVSLDQSVDEIAQSSDRSPAEALWAVLAAKK